MKSDRILEIIIYLINHDNVPASYLAERFHVSVRTIQRDMVSISSIGIPVYAEGGKYGGYSILPTFKLQNSNIGYNEQQMIIKALESLATSYTSDTLEALIEKYNAIIEKEGGQKVFWDFGVTRENQYVQSINRLLEQAIAERKHITGKNRSNLWNHWRYIISGTHGIYFPIHLKRNSIGHLKLPECRICM